MPGTLEQPALFIEGRSPIMGINPFHFSVSQREISFKGQGRRLLVLLPQEINLAWVEGVAWWCHPTSLWLLSKFLEGLSGGPLTYETSRSPSVTSQAQPGWTEMQLPPADINSPVSSSSGCLQRIVKE